MQTACRSVVREIVSAIKERAGGRFDLESLDRNLEGVSLGGIDQQYRSWWDHTIDALTSNVDIVVDIVAKRLALQAEHARITEELEHLEMRRGL